MIVDSDCDVDAVNKRPYVMKCVLVRSSVITAVLRPYVWWQRRRAVLG